MFSCCNKQANDTAAEIAGIEPDKGSAVLETTKPEAPQPVTETPPAPAPTPPPVVTKETPKEEPKPTRPSPTVTTGAKKWTVTVSKPLGANVEPLGTACVVSKVLTSGGVATWNKGNASKTIIDGDVIVSANRAGPNYPDITKTVVEATGTISLEMKREINLAMCVVLVKEPGLKLGLTIEPSHSNQCLTVIELPGSDTMVTKLNDAFPAYGIKTGDVIVQVENTSGSEEMINELQTFMKSTATDQVKVYIERK